MVAIAQAATGHSSAANPSVTTGSVTAGNLLLITFGTNPNCAGINYPTVTIGGNAETVIPINASYSGSLPGSGTGALWCYVRAAHTGTATISFVQTGSSSIVENYSYVEFSGLTAPSVDVVGTWAAVINQSSWASPSITTLIAADLVIAYWTSANGTAQTFTPPSGWTQCYTPTSGSTNHLQAAYYQVEAAVGTYTATLGGSASSSAAVDTNTVGIIISGRLTATLQNLAAQPVQRAATW